MMPTEMELRVAVATGKLALYSEDDPSKPGTLVKDFGEITLAGYAMIDGATSVEPGPR